MLNRITVQLPVEGLLFWKLTGREAMSESFALTLTVLGTDARIDRSKLLGQPVTVTIPTQSLLTSRYVNGKITRVAVSAVELTGTRYAVYQLTVEPDLWPMKRDRNLRIFQGRRCRRLSKPCWVSIRSTLRINSPAATGCGTTACSIRSRAWTSSAA
jgi:type VI secretion system secreted protein VgrG